MDTLKLPVFVGKILTLGLGLIILAVGLHSHFQSAWTQSIGMSPDDHKLYEICHSEKHDAKRQCPSISMERYFVSIITICFVISLFGIIAGYFFDFQNHRPLKIADTVFHGTSAFLLLVAAVVYLISAAQIDNQNIQGISKFMESDLNFRKSEKIAAAAMTILQSYLYGMVAVLISVS